MRGIGSGRTRIRPEGAGIDGDTHPGAPPVVSLGKLIFVFLVLYFFNSFQLNCINQLTLLVSELIALKVGRNAIQVTCVRGTEQAPLPSQLKRVARASSCL